MKNRLTHCAAVLLAGATLMSCSSDSGSDEGSNPIDGVQTDSKETGVDDEPSSDATLPDDGADRPQIQLPEDMNNVFENTDTGDSEHDAILSDVVAGINAVDMAIAESNPELPAVEFYNIGDALVNARNYIRGGSDNDRSWAGTAEYYDFSVSTPHPEEASVTYCIDTTGVQTKELDTGELLPKPEDARNFNYTQIVLHQNDLDVWQVATVLERDAELDRRCER